MDKKYLLVVLAIIGMGVLYKRSLQTMQQGATPSVAGTARWEAVTFITSDGKKFPIPRDAAEKLDFVETALEAQPQHEGIPSYEFSMISSE